MRHTPSVFPKEPYRSQIVTETRLRFARESLEKERASWGMFADQMVTETAEERIRRQDDITRQEFRRRRQETADLWRRGRRALFALPEEERRDLLVRWNNMHGLPGSPEYFLDFLRGVGVEVESEPG
jgi:hypothetical protein